MACGRYPGKAQRIFRVRGGEYAPPCKAARERNTPVARRTRGRAHSGPYWSARELRGFPPLAQRSAKKLINDIEDAGLSLAVELEGQCYGRLRGSDDFREGVEAFHQKRRPAFRAK